MKKLETRKVQSKTKSVFEDVKNTKFVFLTSSKTLFGS